LLIVIFRMLLLELSPRGYYRMSLPCPKLWRATLSLLHLIHSPLMLFRRWFRVS
jgi:hypothetical protein